MKNAFEINSKFKSQNAKIKSALLVDDILTTGSTFYEAAKILKKNGFSQVWGVAFAREQ